MPGVYYPAYRLAIIVVALAVALMLYLVVMRTRIGMLIRAGASNREMIGALGINIKLLYTLVFGLGAALAGLAGLMQAPILTVQIGMGENILILAFVIIVIGGIGSIRGAFLAAIFVGMIDTLGRAFLPDLLRQVLSSAAASTAAPALSSMLIYLSDGDRAGGAAGGAVSGQPAMSVSFNARNVVAALVVAGLLLLPLYSQLSGNVFALTLFTRIVIFALAAASLNLIMGYGGMMSFGHAAYLGIGGYAVGILAYEGIGSGFIQWPVALAASALFALVIGALSSAHPRRLFHHDHARLCADGLLRRVGAIALRRRRRPDHLQAQRFRRPHQSVEPRAVLLSLPRLPVRRNLSDLAHRQFALRPGGAGPALQRGAHAGDRLSRHALPARLLRHRGHACAVLPARCSPTTPISSVLP